jgi:serine phosphatase RsbU (regulator of sigma subunit)
VRWLVLSLLASSAVAVADAWLAGTTVLISLLIVGPLVAAVSLGGGYTAAVGAWSLALALVLGVPDGIFGTTDHLVRCLVVALGGAFCAVIAGRRTQGERELVRMTQLAEVAQRAILRPIPARIGGVLFAARYLSATHQALIGGDFYDVALSPYGLRVVVGDVKGKGVDAVRLASLVLGSFREAAFSRHDLVDVVAELDRSIARYLGEEDFVTSVMVEFDTRGGLEVVNCGHPPPLLLHGTSAELLTSPVPSPPLGLAPSPAQHRVEIVPGDRLLLYTDGLIEARAADGHYFDLDGQAAQALAARSLSDALDDLVKRVLDHVGGKLDDDMALVLAQPRRTISRRRAA